MRLIQPCKVKRYHKNKTLFYEFSCEFMTLNLREYFSFFLRKFKAVILEILNKPKGPNKSIKLKLGLKYCPFSFARSHFHCSFPINLHLYVTSVWLQLFTFQITEHQMKVRSFPGCVGENKTPSVTNQENRTRERESWPTVKDSHLIKTPKINREASGQCSAAIIQNGWSAL